MATHELPWLSILIPAYERPDGVRRILDAIVKEKNISGIECLVGDDSHTGLVEAAVRNHKLFLEGKVTYWRNTPSLGAIANWNDLLERAIGTHLIFMHHDEFPVTKGFFEKMQRHLQLGYDCIVLNCWIADKAGSNAVPHSLGWTKRIVLRYVPTYLMRRNVIGAPSMMVLRRELAPRFDSRLPRLVDVDWYCTFLGLPNICATFASDLCVASIFYVDSITGRLGSDLNNIASKESALLREEGKHMPSIVICAPTTKIEIFKAFLENLAWKLFRLTEYPFRIALKRSLISLST
jgi:glycosyltransferase involved in cell wall biosynthesis